MSPDKDNSGNRILTQAKFKFDRAEHDVLVMYRNVKTTDTLKIVIDKLGGVFESIFEHELHKIGVEDIKAPKEMIKVLKEKQAVLDFINYYEFLKQLKTDEMNHIIRDKELYKKLKQIVKDLRLFLH